MSEKLQEATIKALTEEDNKKYCVKLFYNNKFIGYLNSYAEGYSIAIRVVDGTDESLIRKYNTERGAKIAAKSDYFTYATNLMLYKDGQYIATLRFKSSKKDGLNASKLMAEPSIFEEELVKVDWTEIEQFKI